MWLSAIKLAVSTGSKLYANRQKTKQAMSDARLMQQGDIADEKMEQNEKLAKLRAGVSLAKAGAQQATIVTEDN